jgi:hypothetical protein
MTQQPSETLEMKVELTIIDNLGIKMYVSLPKVISELVANSWDADATRVDIDLPEGSINDESEIVIADTGCGMNFEDINRLYLRVGRLKREEDGTDLTPVYNRRVMGRKGIGKLSVFGVAKIVDVETCRDNVLTSFRMDIDKIMAVSKAGQLTVYKPDILRNKERVNEKNGTTIRLKRLKRTESISKDSIRTRLTRRFSVLCKNFEVYINGDQIKPDERLLEDEIEFKWEIKNEKILDGREWAVDGWIGTLKESVEDIDPGVILMARGKLAQEPFFFGLSAGEKFAFHYIVGELNAEFLDEEEDLIATHRGSAIWESPQGDALTSWGRKKLMEIANDWSEKRRQEREKGIREEPQFQEWLKTLTGPEEKVANKVIKIVTSEEKLSDDRRKEIMSYVKTSFDQQAFRELVSNLEEDPSSVNILAAFEEWRVIEAREILRLVKGRLETIEQFDHMIKTNAKEVPTIHKFFAKFPWILDPSWIEVYDEVPYSTLLRKKYPDDKLKESDRRIDFVCMGVGDTVHVVELKRPDHKINWEDLNQLERYVTFIRGKLGTSCRGRSYRSAAGYIVAGDIVDKNEIQERMKNMELSRMYVLKYEDCLRSAQRLHEIFSEKLEEFEKSKKPI